jgi:hypothetical protein
MLTRSTEVTSAALLVYLNNSQNGQTGSFGLDTNDFETLAKLIIF